jgi:sulfide:quinone oxidoreductase
VDPRKLSDNVSVAPQLEPADIAEAARLGFRTVINNRPDGEGMGQPRNAELESLARELGLEYHYQPVVSGALALDDVLAFRQLLAAAQTPVLAFCRSGTRCATLWALAQAGQADADSVISAAAQAGYDVSGLRQVIERGL